MPKSGRNARPYNKDEKIVAAANKRLRDRAGSQPGFQSAAEQSQGARGIREDRDKAKAKELAAKLKKK